MLSSDRMLMQNSHTSVIVTEQIDFVSVTFINTSLPGLMISTIFCTMSCHACTRKVLYTVHVLSFNFMDIRTCMTLIITKVGLVQRIDDIHTFKH